MPNIYLEISITGNQEQRDILLPTMIELGCEGFEETDTALLCFINKTRWTEENDRAFRNSLLKKLQVISSNSVIGFREIVDQNWNEEWEKTIQPIEIGKRLVVKPSWATYDNADDRIIIQIDPKMSFGTGYHETTRLTLQLLEKYTSAGCSMLDVGTGTGILAIAAIKLGALSSIGTDIDEWSIDNAVENIHSNQVQDHIKIEIRDLKELTSSSFDLITANLTLNTNIELLEEFYRIVKLHGLLLLSGLLTTDKEQMVLELRKKKFEVSEIVWENEWIAIAAHKTK